MMMVIMYTPSPSPLLAVKFRVPLSLYVPYKGLDQLDYGLLCLRGCLSRNSSFGLRRGQDTCSRRRWDPPPSVAIQTGEKGALKGDTRSGSLSGGIDQVRDVVSVEHWSGFIPVQIRAPASCAACPGGAPLGPAGSAPLGRWTGKNSSR